jgi:hypothetical protein
LKGQFIVIQLKSPTFFQQILQFFISIVGTVFTSANPLISKTKFCIINLIAITVEVAPFERDRSISEAHLYSCDKPIVEEI